jgi:hypothetical protein
MTMRPDPGTDDRLAEELRALAQGLEMPETPDLVSPVRAALEMEGPPAVARRWRVPGFRPVRLSVAFAMLALVAAAGIVAATVLVLGGLRIAFVDHLPSVPPETAPSGPLGSNLGLGTQIDLSAAKARVQFKVFIPTTTALAKPDDVYYSNVLAGGQVSLVYGPADGRPPATDSGVAVLITEFPGSMEEDLAQKSVGPGTTVEILTVNGGLAFWIEGRPHVIAYRDPTGNRVPDFMRLVHNALAWEQDGTVLRIEGDLTREQAIAIAGSFAAAP